MRKKQLGIRIPEVLLARLDHYAKAMKTSKTEIVIGALAQYLDSPENIPLGERVRAVESKLAQIEAQLKKIRIEG